MFEAERDLIAEKMALCILSCSNHKRKGNPSDVFYGNTEDSSK